MPYQPRIRETYNTPIPFVPHFPISSFPRHVRAPVQADHVSGALLHDLQLAHAAIGVEDERGVGMLGLDGGDDALRVGLRKLGKLLRRKMVRPAVEELHHLRAAVDLMAHVHRQCVGQVGEVGVERLGILRHDLLGVDEVAVGAALHGIRRQRPRRADEAEQGASAVHFVAEAGEDLADEWEGRVWIVQCLQSLDVVHRADGVGDDWAFPLFARSASRSRERNRMDIIISARTAAGEVVILVM